MNDGDMYNAMVESNKLGILFCRQGNYQMAVMFHLQALKIAETLGGKLSVDYCDSLYNLGNTCADAGNYDVALKYLLAAEQNAIMRGATEDMSMVHLLNSIAYAMEGSGDFDGAVSHLESALVKLRKLAENDARLEADNLLRDTYYLAGVCEKAEDMKKALAYYTDVLLLIRKLGLKYYPSCLNSLASVLTVLGDLDRALGMRLEAAAQIKNAIGSRSISYAQSLRNLAVVYRNREDYGRAKELLQEAVDIKRQILGMASRETISEILFLIELHAASDDVDTALDIFIRLLGDIDENFENHDEIIRELANVYMGIGDINRLNELYNRAAEMYGQMSDEDEET